MVQSLTISGFRCFDPLVWRLESLNSCLVLGSNGSGKSSLGDALVRLASPDGPADGPGQVAAVLDPSSGPADEFWSRAVVVKSLSRDAWGPSSEEGWGPGLGLEAIGSWAANLAEQHDGFSELLLAAAQAHFPALQSLELPAEPKSNPVWLTLDGGRRRADELSDGEKILMAGAVFSVAARMGQVSLLFWDEPDSWLAPDRIELFVRGLRAGFRGKGLFILTSHQEEAALGFGEESTFVLVRERPALPSRLFRLDELSASDRILAAAAASPLSA